MAGTATFTAVVDPNILPDSNAREETYWGTITIVAGVGNDRLRYRRPDALVPRRRPLPLRAGRGQGVVRGRGGWIHF